MESGRRRGREECRRFYRHELVPFLDGSESWWKIGHLGLADIRQRERRRRITSHLTGVDMFNICNAGKLAIEGDSKGWSNITERENPPTSTSKISVPNIRRERDVKNLNRPLTNAKMDTPPAQNALETARRSRTNP